MPSRKNMLYFGGGLLAVAVAIRFGLRSNAIDGLQNVTVALLTNEIIPGVKV